MKPERWQQIDKILEAALEREGSQRAAFLDQACGSDETLREKVEALLAAHKQGEHFLEEPALEVAAEGLAKEQVELLVGRQLGSYKILSLLGAGGMGEVFLAQDTTLDRKVALKFLPEELQQDSTAKKRFLREAKSAAALDHPFICHIHEVGELEGKSFISMEYVQGETLSQRLTEGPLPLKDALQTAVEVAEALEAAHKHDIVHRDLKPSNIMLTSDGHVKVMDFGLAKRVTPAEGQEQEITTALTREGSTLGTIPYMSPEQLKGQPVDARSDIFSFGVVLYEMLAGVHPFKKGGHMETAKAVLSDTAPPLTRYTEDIPLLLQHTIKKMLAKEPDRRYQLIHEVRTNLGELIVTSWDSEGSAEVPGVTSAKRSYLWPVVAGGLAVAVLLLLVLLVPFTAGPPEEAINSIAILPFENASDDPEMAYLSDGIAGNIIDSLTQLESLRVIPTSSVARYKGQDISPGAVAEDLGIRAVLTGIVVQRGDDLSLRVELVDTVEDRLLWGEQYNWKLTETLALQEEIAKEISEKLRLEITGEEESQLSKRGTQNPEAYDDYLKGRYYFDKGPPDGYETAIEHFKQAIGLDPTYAQAYAGLADTYYLQAQFGQRTVRDVYALEMSAAQKALELDASLAEAHVSMASIKGYHDLDWSTAETEFKRAIELNPNSPRAHQAYAFFLAMHRRLDEALAEAKKARELDPLSLQINNWIGAILLFKREYDEAIEQFQKTLEIDPSYSLANQWLVNAYWAKGEHEQAIAHIEKGNPMSPRPGAPFNPLLFRHALSGNWVEAIRILEATEMAPQIKARWYMRLGETDRAIEVVKTAMDEGRPAVPHVNVWPEFDPLRDDPRFQDLLRRMNLEP